MMIRSIDIGGKYAYFSAVQFSNDYGNYNSKTSYFIAGKIDLSTLDYTAIDPDRNVTAIISY
ncbi:hypothetical protein FACS1894110_11010 [Spirochaetia bacterium]|nr:hypothetical protein FACS1894110_11010 [Spirochaetia bacterium]